MPGVAACCARLALCLIVGVIIIFLVLVLIRIHIKPTRPPPGTTRISIINNDWADGVVFCRGPVQGTMGLVFVDEEMTTSVVRSQLDCAVPGSRAALQWGVGVPQGTTLALGLKRFEETTLYIHPNGSWPSGACWFQDAASNQRTSLAKGPRFMSQVEFTIQPSGSGQIFYDLTSVEGVSGGVTMNYTDDLGKLQTCVAVPAKFSGSKLSVVPAPGIGFPTVMSDKNTLGECNCLYWNRDDPACNTDACLASCPGNLVDNACGQHRCRVFYSKQYEDSTSYCGWLFGQNAQTYCWAMDEWVCTDKTCGYGAPDQPEADCTSPLPPNAAANTYSCGHGTEQPSGTPGQLFWTSGPGCVDKFVQGVPTNPAPSRLGGRITLSFESLPWLHE